MSMILYGHCFQVALETKKHGCLIWMQMEYVNILPVHSIFMVQKTVGRLWRFIKVVKLLMKLKLYWELPTHGTGKLTGKVIHGLCLQAIMAQ